MKKFFAKLLPVATVVLGAIGASGGSKAATVATIVSGVISAAMPSVLPGQNPQPLQVAPREWESRN